MKEGKVGGQLRPDQGGQFTADSPDASELATEGLDFSVEALCGSVGSPVDKVVEDDVIVLVDGILDDVEVLGSQLLKIVAPSGEVEFGSRLFAVFVVEGRQLHGHIVIGCDVRILLEEDGRPKFLFFRPLGVMDMMSITLRSQWGTGRSPSFASFSGDWR